jgi:YggT family protein
MIVTHPLVTALVFLINVFFGTYILLVMLRFLLQLIRVVVRHDPLLRVLWKVTDPPLLQLYNFIPGWKSIDFSAIVLMFLLKMMELTLTAWLYGQYLSVQRLFIVALASLLYLALYIFFCTIILQVILSWVSPYDSYNNPLSQLLHQLNDPILRPVRRHIPPVQGIDFSPFIVIVGLQLLIILIDESLRYYAI